MTSHAHGRQLPSRRERLESLALAAVRLKESAEAAAGSVDTLREHGQINVEVLPGALVAYADGAFASICDYLDNADDLIEYLTATRDENAPANGAWDRECDVLEQLLRAVDTSGLLLTTVARRFALVNDDGTPRIRAND